MRTPHDTKIAPRSFDRPLARRAVHFLGTLLIVAASLLQQGCIIDQIDAAIEQLQTFNHTFEDIERILRNLQLNLDAGVYRDQVNDIVGRAGQVAQLSVMSTVDFVRTRVVEDLQRIRAQIKHEPPPPRVPHLANVQVPYVDAQSQSLTTVSIVGWNLDVAQSDQENRYAVEIENAEGARRRVSRQFVSYAGQYQINVNVSGSGVPLQVGDSKLVFRGFTPAFEVPIINSDGVALKRLRFESNQDRDDKDRDIKVHVRLSIGGTIYLDQHVGKGWEWPDMRLVRVEMVAAESDQKPCLAEAIQRWGFPGYLQHRSEFDENCLHRVVDSRMRQLPVLTGRRDAVLTVETLEDSSGWGTTLSLVGVTDRTAPGDLHQIFRTDSHMFNRHGNGSSRTWEFKW